MSRPQKAAPGLAPSGRKRLRQGRTRPGRFLHLRPVRRLRDRPDGRLPDYLARLRRAFLDAVSAERSAATRLRGADDEISHGRSPSPAGVRLASAAIAERFMASEGFVNHMSAIRTQVITRPRPDTGLP